MTEYEEILSRMERTYKEETGCEPNEASDIGIRLRLLARELSRISEEIDTARKEAFLETATGEFLSLHAEQRGLKRKMGTFARGRLIFLRDTPAEANIAIPRGTIASSEGGLEFETTEDGTLKKGETRVAILARCLERGKIGNAAAGAVCSLVSPIGGILSLDSESFSGGSEEETDEELRKRLLWSFSSSPNGTNSAFYQKLALETPGVSFARIIPRKNGIGTVHAVLGGKDKSKALPREVVEEFLKKASLEKEINVDITAESARLVPQGVKIEIALEDGGSLAEEKERVALALRDYINEIEIGESFYVAKALSKVMDLDLIKNARILEPLGDINVSFDSQISPGEIVVTEMAVV